MSALTLLRDTLLERVGSLDPGAALSVMLGAWLRVETVGDPHALAEVAAVRSGGARSYRDVAALGFAQGAGIDHEQAFADGVSWLAGREYFRPGRTPTLEADPLAMLGLAVGVRHVGADSKWLVALTERATEVMVDEWDQGLVSAARAVLGVDHSRLPSELAAALATRGLVHLDGNEPLAMDRIYTLADHGPDRSIVILAALRQLAASELPHRESETMADLSIDKLRSNAKISIITALPKEFAALRLVFGNGKEWKAPGTGAGRRFRFTTVPSDHGGEHVVAMAVLPDMGNNTAASAATVLLEQVPSIEHVIMCGIAGGVPRVGVPEHDVRLGDIVVSNRNGIVQYDLVKEHPDGSKEHRHPPRPPGSELLDAVRHLQVEEELDNRPWVAIAAAAGTGKWARPGDDVDAQGRVVEVPPDPERTPGQARVFSATIASANNLLKNATHRDHLAKKFGVKAVEMEGSGVADATWIAGRDGYLVVRGVVDYCDGGKGDRWHRAGALAAASYARALVGSMHTSRVAASPNNMRRLFFREIAGLLAQNHEVWSQFGPESPAATANPMSNSAQLWTARKLDTIVPNNGRIVQLIQENLSALSIPEVRVAQRFINHATAFEENCRNRSEDVPRFPPEFEEMVTRG